MKTLRTPKGTLDFQPEEALKQQDTIEKIRKIFELHNARPFSTPIFELRSVLLNKYGEEAKLIYYII